MSVLKWFKRALGIAPENAAVPFPPSPKRHMPSQQVPVVKAFTRLDSADFPRDSMEGLLSQVAELQTKRAAWPEIWATLNPTHDPQLQQLLVELRGPHMFVPHIALNALEEGCRRVARTHPLAGRLAVLKAALDSCNRIIRDD